MAYISFQPKDYFNTVQWTGNASTNAITGVGFRPDWVWGKSHTSGYSHQLYDAVRGATEVIRTNGTNSETLSTGLTSFDSDGFTLGSNTNINASGHTVTGWNWRANGAGSSNTDGSITSTVSASTTSGFSIVTYTGTGANATIGHGLGTAPSVVICKQRNATQQWINYHKAIGATKYLHLNATDASATSSTVWNDTDPTSSVFSVGTAVNCNGSGNTYVAYCFAEKKGFSKFGSYTGNGNADGAFVYTGFAPAFIMLKNASTAQDWQMYTWDMQPYNEFCTTSAGRLKANTTDAQSTKTAFDMLSNGFKMRTNASDINASGNEIIYMAFAEEPLVSSNGVPATAR